LNLLQFYSVYEHHEFAANLHTWKSIRRHNRRCAGHSPADADSAERGQRNKGEPEMKTKLALVLVVMATALVSHAPAYAQGMMAGRGAGGMFGGPMMAAYLGLTEDQLSQLKTLRSSHEAATKPLMQQLQTYRQQLRLMTQSTTPLNTAQLKTLANQMSQVETQLTVDRAQMEWQFFNNVLTPDQQAKLTSMQDQMRQMRENWKQNHAANPGTN
jgi:Spy/CpxP family protein refolding chaperone